MADEINPGIRRVVAWLNDNGFATIDSGDGETHDHACDRDEPYVVIRVSPVSLVFETRRLLDLLVIAKIEPVPIGRDGGVWIEASYDPADESAVININHIHDRLLP